MSKRFSVHTTVNDPTGASHTFAIGDEAPDWALDVINNPAVFATPIDESSESSYEDLKVQDLLHLAKERGVDLQGTHKADIIEALEADDAANNG